MKRKLMMFLPFLLFGLLFLPVYAQEPVVPPEPEPCVEAVIDWPCFKPTKITFNYAYTNEHSIDNITTVGQSVYKHSGGPTFLEFIAQDIDTYSFILSVRYTNATEQTILIGLWSGILPMNGFSVKGRSNLFVIKVRLSVTEQPTYPTETEVAKEVVNQIQQNLVIQQEENRRLMEELKASNMTISALSVATTILVVIALILSAFSFRATTRIESG